MGDVDWQIWVTLAIVAGAATVIGRRALIFFSGGGRSACHDCSAKPAVKDRTDRVISETEIHLMYQDSDR